MFGISVTGDCARTSVRRGNRAPERRSPTFSKEGSTAGRYSTQARRRSGSDLGLSDCKMDCVRPPRDDTGASTVAPVARSRKDGLHPVISGFLHIALLAEKFLRPWSPRFQNYLSFDFCHGLSTRRLAPRGSPTMQGTIVHRSQSGIKIAESATGADG